MSSHDETTVVLIDFAHAQLVDSVDLLTFDGLQSLKIPEGTQSNAILRIKGLGVPFLNAGGRGDLYVHIDVRIPNKLTREQKKLFEQLRDTLPAENEPENKGLFDKVKDIFS